MQHEQLSFKLKMRSALAGFVLLAAENLAAAGTMAHASKPDPLLDGPPGPCAGLAAGADYAAGADADGNPVAPADVGAAPVPVPDSIAIPLHQGPQRRGRGNPVTAPGDSPYVTLDGRKLAPLLNPPVCR